MNIVEGIILIDDITALRAWMAAVLDASKSGLIPHTGAIEEAPDPETGISRALVHLRIPADLMSVLVNGVPGGPQPVPAAPGVSILAQVDYKGESGGVMRELVMDDLDARGNKALSDSIRQSATKVSTEIGPGGDEVEVTQTPEFGVIR